MDKKIMNKKNLILGLVMALSIAGIYLLQFGLPFTIGGGEYTVCISDSVTGGPVQGVDIKCSVTHPNGFIVRDIDRKTGTNGCASFSAYDVESWTVQWIWKSGYVDYDYPGTVSGDVYSAHILAYPPQVTTTLPAPTTSTTTTTTTTSSTTTTIMVIEEPPEPDNIIQAITQWIQDIIAYFMGLIN